MSPIAWEHYMIDGETYTPPTTTTPANYKIAYISVILDSPTVATIVAASPATIPGSYSGVASTSGSFSGFSALDHRPLVNADGIFQLT